MFNFEKAKTHTYTWLEFDKNVNIAQWSEIIPQHRAKQGHPLDATVHAELGKLLTRKTETTKNYHHRKPTLTTRSIVSQRRTLHDISDSCLDYSKAACKGTTHHTFFSPNLAITCCKSSHVLPLSPGVRSRYAGWYVGITGTASPTPGSPDK